MAEENNNLTVTMLRVSGKGSDSQWFDYRPTFFANIVRVEWELDTMQATIARDAAEYLVKHGYATLAPPTPPEPKSPPPSPAPEPSSGGKRKKEKSNDDR